MIPATYTLNGNAAHYVTLYTKLDGSKVILTSTVAAYPEGTPVTVDQLKAAGFRKPGRDRNFDRLGRVVR
jgi:hypothetical protein